MNPVFIERNVFMEDIKIQKVTTQIIRKPGVRSFSVIGDPGCEGLGTSMMQVYCNALQTASSDDFILVAGDLVPVGSARHYQKVCSLTNAIAQKDVYVLRGNHDTGAYSDFFGLQDYTLITDDFTIVVVDNALRTFSEEGLRLLGEVLAMDECQNVVVAFHIPLPNHFIRNSVTEEEFQRLKNVYSPWKEKIKFFLCGHVHSRFEDVIDGIPFICTGGGGAMIEDVSEEIKASDIDYHIIRFEVKNGALSYKIVDLGDRPYLHETADLIMEEKLADAVKGELYAHLRYLSFAERAEKRGYNNIGNLFRALAESEYRHARSFFSVLEQPSPFSDTAQRFIPLETFEYEKLYRLMADYAKEHSYPLSNQAFGDAAAAEKIHAELLKEAADIDGYKEATFFVCPVCGFIMKENDKKERCLICGAPQNQFIKFSAAPEGNRRR